MDWGRLDRRKRGGNLAIPTGLAIPSGHSKSYGKRDLGDARFDCPPIQFRLTDIYTE
jgi:hypothetical protein